jgi:hypothetical protein
VALKRTVLPLLVGILYTVRPAGAVECIRGPYLQNAAVGAIEVRWELDRVGPSAVEYESPEVGWRKVECPLVEYESREWGWRKVECPFKGRKHRVRLTGLAPGALYRYRIVAGTQLISGEYSFRATPGPGGAQRPTRFTFAVFGDMGAGTPGQMEVAQLLERSAAEFTLICGDIIYSRGEEEHYDLRFFEPYKVSLPRMTFWPALGNHDVGSKDGAAALAAFDVPLNGPAGLQGGRNYSFDYGNAHIAAIDSNASAKTLKNVIGPWLEKDMAASKATWRFVFFHHPPYSSSNHGENAKMRDVMVPFFAKSKIDIVFAGHDHSYERTRPMNGVTYVVSGNGGNRLYEHKNPHPQYTEVFYTEKHGLTLISIDGARLTLRHVDVDGREIDRFELEK